MTKSRHRREDVPKLQIYFGIRHQRNECFYKIFICRHERQTVFTHDIVCSVRRGIHHINLMQTPSCQGVSSTRADASEKSTKIAYSVIMKSANYPHANLANLAKGASLRPRLSASPPTRMSVGCDDCRFIGTKECCLQPFQPDGKLRAFCDAVFA